jgi:hypothetical protein
MMFWIDKHQFNEEEYDRHGDDEIEEEKEEKKRIHFWLNYKTSICNEIDFNVITIVITNGLCRSESSRELENN